MHSQQDQVSHRPLRQPSDADLLLVWPLLLLLSPRRGYGLFAGDGRLPNWLQLLRPSRLTWIAKRQAVRLPSRLQFIDRLGRPRLRNAKLFGFPPGCSFLDREHDLRKKSERIALSMNQPPRSEHPCPSSYYVVVDSLGAFCSGRIWLCYQNNIHSGYFRWCNLPIISCRRDQPLDKDRFSRTSMRGDNCYDHERRAAWQALAEK